MSTFQNKELAVRFYEEALNGRNLYLLDEICAENFVDHNPEPGKQGSREVVKAMFRGVFEAFPDMKGHIDSIVAEGDRVGAHVTITGTHRGTWNGVPATGRRVTLSGFDWLRVQNGKVTERWGVFDATGMMKQLGMIPGPTASDLKAVSKRYYEMLDKARGDLAAVKNEIFHPLHTSYFSGRGYADVALQQLIHGFYAGFPDLVHVIDEQIAESDTVHNRLTIRGTHKGDFAGAKPTGRTIAVSAMTSHRYVDGKLFEQRVEVDFMSVMVQLGLVPKPA
jgi:steroid delta-isomerase-like uncharacterized protein